MAERSVPVPRGIEVLVKKAAVDAEFHALLVERRAEAADEIGLALDPAEVAMLTSIPASLLEGIIARTTVTPVTRAAFLGKAAAVMLAALGTDLAIADGPAPPGGIAPDPVKPTGITPDRPPGRERYVLYTETNYNGEPTFGVLEESAYAKRSADIARTNRVLRQAYLAAAKAWSDDAHKGTPFPMRMPQLLQCNRVASYSDRDRAEEMLKRRQDDLDRRAEVVKKAEERRLAAMSDEARAREKRKAELLKAAKALFEKELQRLLAAPAEPAPVSRGISPARPPASFGIQP
ncbi:MAG TPA: hypothetical protein VNE39_16070 [Planctomycetota bacterium]|nr:hypothetical protein [Planctomycetota bacterium]